MWSQNQQWLALKSDALQQTLQKLQQDGHYISSKWNAENFTNNYGTKYKFTHQICS